MHWNFHDTRKHFLIHSIHYLNNSDIRGLSQNYLTNCVWSSHNMSLLIWKIMTTSVLKEVMVAAATKGSGEENCPWNGTSGVFQSEVSPAQALVKLRCGRTRYQLATKSCITFHRPYSNANRTLANIVSNVIQSNSISPPPQLFWNNCHHHSLWEWNP